MRNKLSFKRHFKGPASILDNIFVHEQVIRQFTDTHAFIFGHLAYNISKHGKATDSKTTISKRISCERKTVQLGIHELADREWIKQIPDESTPSGFAFIFGEKIPTEIKQAYASIHHKQGKSRKSGFLIQVELKPYNNVPRNDINRKKAAMWRKLAYLRGLIAYRNASHARRCPNGQARAKYVNKSTLANQLNVTLKTIEKYLRLLKEQGELMIVREWNGLYLDACGDLLTLTKRLYRRLERLTALT